MKQIINLNKFFFFRRNKNLLPLHNYRTILSIILLLIASLELFESFIIKIPLLQIITLLSIITLSILHRQSEKRDGLGLAITACGFIIITISRLWRILNKHNNFIMLNNVRLITTIGTCFIGGLLGVIDTYSLCRIVS